MGKITNDLGTRTVGNFQGPLNHLHLPLVPKVLILAKFYPGKVVRNMKDQVNKFKIRINKGKTKYYMIIFMRKIL